MVKSLGSRRVAFYGVRDRRLGTHPASGSVMTSRKRAEVLVCSVPGCGRPHYGRGWCHGCYERWRRYGDPGALKRKPKQQPTVVDWSRAIANLRGILDALK